MPELLVERRGGMLMLRLNRPERANALGPAMVERMIAHFEAPASERLIVIEGTGRLFSAGFDLADIESLSDGDLLHRFVRVEHLLQLVHHSPRPVLCLAHGHAVGAGADLLAASHLRVVAPGTRIRMPGFNFGVMLGTRRLVGVVGPDAARDILIDTRTVDALEARELGLATDIAERERWEDLVDRTSARAAALSPEATADLLHGTRVDTRAADMASLVAGASAPGLGARIRDYQRRAGEQS